jgi:hypothetical protein
MVAGPIFRSDLARSRPTNGRQKMAEILVFSDKPDILIFFAKIAGGENFGKAKTM